MTTQRNFQGPKPKYGTAKLGGEPYSTHSRTNFDGGRVTKKPKNQSASRPQMNFGGTMSIPVKHDPGQGQKDGTGSQGGY